MAALRVPSVLVLLCVLGSLVDASRVSSGFTSGLQMPTDAPEFGLPRLGYAGKQSGSAESESESESESPGGAGVRWALLIAGSSGYWNYRHQADVCHAYQILKRDGLKDENIVVFMYDDIANDEENPHPGTLINHPHGSDVYAGVPKDYTGDEVTVGNFLAVLLGNASAVNGGSGKVIASGPDDHVFVFYSDHGGPGVLGMPTVPYLMADDVIRTLKAKHAMNGYKEMVFYLEACESGSIFQGLLPKNINVYAVTAANAFENSWGTYCPGMYPPPPEEYDTCLGDLFSVSWMEDSDIHNLQKETLLQQYRTVSFRTAAKAYSQGSHVMQYGTTKIDLEKVAVFLGTDPANEDAPPGGQSWVDWLQGSLRNVVLKRVMFLWGFEGRSEEGVVEEMPERQVVDQREADMHYYLAKWKKAKDADAKAKAWAEYSRVSSARKAMDLKMEAFSYSALGASPSVSFAVEGHEDAPLVEDWVCLRTTIRAYEAVCGPLTQYGMQFTRVFAALCNSLPDATDAAAATREHALASCGGDLQFQGPFSV